MGTQLFDAVSCLKFCRSSEAYGDVKPIASTVCVSLPSFANRPAVIERKEQKEYIRHEGQTRFTLEKPGNLASVLPKMGLFESLVTT